MKVLKKIRINVSGERLSKEKMKSIKGGGGSCYSYCDGVLTIRDKCDWSCTGQVSCYGCY